MVRITKRWRRRLACAALAVASAVAGIALGQFRFVQLLHLKASDVQFLVRGRRNTPDIALLLVDQKSLDRIPDLLMFWHPHYAKAIRAAADNGARVLGLDVTFAIPVAKWEPAHDQILAEAVSETAARMPVVCAYVPSAMQKQQDWVVPINMIAAALGLAAYANLTVDPDDFIRRQELIEAPVPGGQEPLARSLALRVAEKYTGADAAFEGGRLLLGGRPVPAGADRRLVINYAGPPGTVPHVSLCDFLDAAAAGNTAQLREWVNGKAVLLGPDRSTEDRHATPFYTTFGASRWNTAGVEIHASTLDTLLGRRFLVPVPPAVRAIAMLAASSLAIAIVLLFHTGAAAAWLAVSALAAWVASHLLFRSGWILPASELLLAALIGVLCGLAYGFLTAERRGRLFKRAVALFVDKRVARSLEEDERISLSGIRQTVTILFSDIRSFTAFCEARDPVEVVSLLNEYLALMVSIIVAHHGHVNKFIGDGILAVFSDLDGTTPGDHAERAVRCGTEMVTAPSRFKTGVGIHCGPVVIGNVGSADKMEYTVLGDTVNVASRLESLNKEMKTRLLLSEMVAERLGGSLSTVGLGAVPIRGQTKPMNLYTAEALRPEPASA